MRQLRITFALGLAMVIAGCEQKDLCMDHTLHVQDCGIQLAADWEREWEYRAAGTDWQAVWAYRDFGLAYDDLRPATPDGIRVTVYPDGGQPEQFNLPATGGLLPLREGTSSILMHNNGTEYIVFNGTGSATTATATTRTRTRVTYIGSPFTKGEDEEQTVNPPDYIFGHFMADYHATKHELPPTVNVTLRPLVCTYLIRYRFAHGLEYVVRARGALAGMAGSVYLTDGRTGSDAVTVLYDADVKSWGVEARVNSFGVPDYPHPTYGTRLGNAFGLNIEVLLRNGKIVSYDFDITDQVGRQPRGGVIEVDGIWVKDEDAAEPTGGGFNVDVDGWGEYEDIPLNF